MKEYLSVRIIEYDETYFSLSKNYNLNEKVVINTDIGDVLGVVTAINKTDNDDFKYFNIVRKADEKDIEVFNKNKEDNSKSIKNIQNIVDKDNLNMKIIDIFTNLERTYTIIFFTAPVRVDFRGLVKQLAQKFKSKIELRQVGVRDKARKVGGIGPCGSEICCSRFLNSFDTISINMAKNQNISLSPESINGACGRLMCCLSYEDDIYTEIKKELNKRRKDAERKGQVISLNPLRKSFTIINKHGNREEIELDDI